METTYSAETVQKILTLAMGREGSSKAQLQEMATELSISDAALESAIALWQRDQKISRQKQVRRQRFYRQQLLPYIAVNGLLIGINLSIAGAITWAIYPLLGWGAALLLNVSAGGYCLISRLSETAFASSTVSRLGKGVR